MRMGFKWCILTYKKISHSRGLRRHTLEFILTITLDDQNSLFQAINFGIQNLISIDFEFIFFFTWFSILYTTTSIFTNVDFIHTKICYGFLNQNNHQECLVLFEIVGHRLLCYLYSN